MDALHSLSLPQLEPVDRFRVPSQYPRCRRNHCRQPPVADMRRAITLRRVGRKGHRVPAWWAYCADHLREYGYEVRNGRAWWVGIPESDP